MAKNAKQQAAIAMAMKAAGKKPKMQNGGSPDGFFKTMSKTSKKPSSTNVMSKEEVNKKINKIPSKESMDAFSSGNASKIADYMNRQKAMNNSGKSQLKKGGIVKSKKK